MAQSDRSAVHVDAFRVQADLPDNCQRLDGEGFVQFDHIDVDPSFRPASARALGIATAGPIPMISGGTPATAKLTNRAIGLKAELAGFRFRHDQGGGGAVGHLRRVARRDGTLRMKDGLQLCQRLHRGVGARTFVFTEPLTGTHLLD